MSEMVTTKANIVNIESLSYVVTKGTTPTSLGHNFQSSGIPFLRAENVFFNNLKLNWTQAITYLNTRKLLYLARVGYTCAPMRFSSNRHNRVPR